MKPKHITQEAWDEAKRLIKKAPSEWSLGGHYRDDVSSGTYIEEDGSLSCDHLGGYVCHAFMQRAYAGRHLFFNTMKREFYNESVDTVKAVEAFCRWMKDASPVRKFILNDDYDSMYNGGIIIDCTRCPSNTLLWICKAFRAAYEDTWRIPIWHKLVGLGVHPMMALCYAQCVGSDWMDYGYSTHCSCMRPPASKEDVANLFIDHVKRKPPVKPQDKIELEEEEEDDDDWYASDDNWETADVFLTKNEYKWSDEFFYLPSRGKVKKKIPDGWGGYIMKMVPLDPKRVAEKLKEIQKEYM